MFTFTVLREALLLNMTGFAGTHRSADPSFHPLIHSTLAPMAITMHNVAE
jgi:hypothetical protein